MNHLVRVHAPAGLGMGRCTRRVSVFGFAVDIHTRVRVRRAHAEGQGKIRVKIKIDRVQARPEGSSMLICTSKWKMRVFDICVSFAWLLPSEFFLINTSGSHGRFASFYQRPVNYTSCLRSALQVHSGIPRPRGGFLCQVTEPKKPRATLFCLRRRGRFIGYNQAAAGCIKMLPKRGDRTASIFT